MSTPSETSSRTRDLVRSTPMTSAVTDDRISSIVGSLCCEVTLQRVSMKETIAPMQIARGMVTSIPVGEEEKER